ASDKVEATGPHNRLFAIPLAGGAPRDLGRMPMGEVRTGKQGIALVAKNEVALLEAGTSKKIATLSGDGSSPVWIDDGIVVLANNVSQGNECCDLVRVSTKDGSVTPIGKLKGIGHALVAVDGTDSFVAEVTTGETVKLDHTGTLTAMGSPGAGVYTCVAATATDLWWARLVDKDKKIIITSMPRNGGPIASVAELAQTGTSCAAGRGELFYTDGNHIKAIAPGGKPRNVVDTAGAPRTLAVDGDNLYWAEDTGTKYSVRTASIK
ncbi:MAG TPA: hypothetical protein VGC41_20480, partial [Kofleriaceae bacterium]